MDQRVSLFTLGVTDLDLARKFYETLGWTTGQEADDVVFFQAGPMVVALWDRAKLAEDSAVTDGGGWGGVTLAYNTRSPEEVDTVIEEARAAERRSGGSPARPSGAATRGLHRPRRPSLGGCPQSALDSRGRRRGDHLGLSSGIRGWVGEARLAESAADGGIPCRRPAVIPPARGASARALARARRLP